MIEVAADAVVAKDAVVIDPENDPVLICADEETMTGLLMIVVKSTWVDDEWSPTGLLLTAFQSVPA